jgi:hypothetical protein
MSFLCPSTHAEHKKTPVRVSLRVRCLSFVLPLMPRMELHWRFVFNIFPSHAEHQKTPTRVSFRVCHLPRNHRGCTSGFVFNASLSHAECQKTHLLVSFLIQLLFFSCRAWNYTIKGVVSCLFSFLCPTCLPALAIVETDSFLMLILGA